MFAVGPAEKQAVISSEARANTGPLQEQEGD